MRINRKIRKQITISTIISILIGILIFIFKRNIIESIIYFFSTFFIILVYLKIKETLKKSTRIKKLEEIFPDFLQLMSSNLRAGMTVDRAILLSSRPEFAPLDEEILQTGKDLATGKDIAKALLEMSKRLESERIHKTILLVISGIQAGGDLAILLEQTAVSMRERKFVEKKAASSVLMYVIFIFLAVSIFAPALFSLSNVLVEVLTNILSGLPEVDAGANLPFTLSKINISISFIKYFSIIFMITIDFFSALVLGLVSKGEEKQGLKYFPVIVALSMAVFFGSRIIIARFLEGLL